jgi:hypothetical protein
MIPDGQSATDYILFSMNRGKSWEKKTFKVTDKSWFPLFTTLDPDSVSLKIIMAVAVDKRNGKRFMLSIDFTQLYSRKCEFNAASPSSSPDFELFTPLSASTGVCLMVKAS